MKVSRVILSYLLSCLIPPFVLILIGFITEPEDCGQCKALLIVGALLVMLRLLVIHLLQFLGLFRLKNAFLDRVLLIVCSFSSTIIVAYSLLEEWISTGDTMFDWQLFWAPLTVNFGLGCFAFWAIKTTRKPVQKNLSEDNDTTADVN